MITDIKNQIELVWDEVMKMFAITTNNHHVWGKLMLKCGPKL